MTEDDKCLRCGQCCHFLDNMGRVVRCRNLIDTDDGKTKCKIYKDRIGTIIWRLRDNVARCKPRVESKYDFRGCPYNTGLPIMEVESGRR